MAGPYMGGYTPPGSYGNYGPGYGQQMYQSPVAQQLTRMENQYPQYGQTVPPQYQQGQPMQNGQQLPQQPQQNHGMAQQPNTGPTMFIINSLDELGLYPRDTDGNPQVFIVKGDDNLYARRLDPATGATDFAVYSRQEKDKEGGERPDSASNDLEKGKDKNSLRDEVMGMLENFRKEIASIKEEMKGELEHARNVTNDDERSTGAAAIESNDATDGAGSDAAAKSGSGRGNKPTPATRSQPGKQQTSDGAEGQKA